MTKKKIAIIICSVILVASFIVGGTLAYLTDNETVTNTFTVGKVEIGLTEPKWDDSTDGKNMVPGDTYDKDPTVAAIEGESYMRIKMEILDNAGALITNADRVNKILQTIYYDPTGTGIVEGDSYTTTDLATYENTNETLFTFDSTRTTDVGVRYYNFTAGDDIFSTADGDAVLFTNIVIPIDFSNDDMATLGSFKIKLTAQAIQSDNVANAEEGYTLLDTEFPG